MKSEAEPKPDYPSPSNRSVINLALSSMKTPSPLPSTPATTKFYGEEVLGKRIRVQQPLEQAWYEGWVKSFDKESNKHLIQYEDGAEELLDLVDEEEEKMSKGQKWKTDGAMKKCKNDGDQLKEG